MKKLILIMAFICAMQQIVLAKEIPVKIKPVSKITTSNLNLQEGDNLDFVVVEDVIVNQKTKIQKGQKVTGIVTCIEENGPIVKPAQIYIENFKTSENHLKLKGIVHKSGNDHNEIMEFFYLEVIRGGEVQIKPEKDEFTIFVEENL